MTHHKAGITGEAARSLPPVVDAFPVRIPRAFAPSDVDGDGIDLGPTGRECPGYGGDHRPRWGGGFEAPRGPQRLAHRAIDIMAAEGAHVVAPSSCTVQTVGSSSKGGHHAFLVDRAGWVWYLAHMRDPLELVAGAELEAGTLIGHVGRTGNAVRVTRDGQRGCPHLHLSLTAPKGIVRLRGPDGAIVLRRGTKVDPVPFLRPLYDAGGWRVP